MPKKLPTRPKPHRPSPAVARRYDPLSIVDASEHHPYARAFGTLTWSTWDHDVRPADQRVADFVSTFPPADPVRHAPGGSLARLPDGTFAPGTIGTRLQRFGSGDSRHGSLPELLARYGLKIDGAPAFRTRQFTPDPFKSTAQRRNIKLRVLHGGVDVEAADMDAAKAAYLDHQESKQAARDVRDALKRMNDDLRVTEEHEE